MAQPVNPYTLQTAPLIIEDALLTRILHDQRFLDAFPFMQSAAIRLKDAVGQRSCCGRTSAAKAASYTLLKQSIAGMTVESKSLFKQLLGAQQVVLIYVNGNQRTRLTF
jgi:hypothetical protein